MATTRRLGDKLVNVEKIAGHWRDSIGKVIASKATHDKNTVFDLTLATGQHLILKQILEHPTTERLASEYRVLAYLHAGGVPVSLPLVTDEGGTFVICDDQVYTLTPALPRDGTFEPKKYPKLYENIGRAIGKLHNALATYPYEISSWTMDLPGRLKNELVPYLTERLAEHERRIFDWCITAQANEICAGLTDLPTQHIHGDCHGGNVLLYQGDVSGFIDLDHLPKGPRIYDLSYYLADRAKNLTYEPELPADWNQEFGQVINGYDSEVVLTAREKRAIWYGMIVTQLLFIDWFLQYRNAAHTTKNLATLNWICEHRKEIEFQAYGKF